MNKKYANSKNSVQFYKSHKLVKFYRVNVNKNISVNKI